MAPTLKICQLELTTTANVLARTSMLRPAFCPLIHECFFCRHHYAWWIERGDWRWHSRPHNCTSTPKLTEGKALHIQKALKKQFCFRRDVTEDSRPVSGVALKMRSVLRWHLGDYRSLTVPSVALCGHRPLCISARRRRMSKPACPCVSLHCSLPSRRASQSCILRLWEHCIWKCLVTV